MASATDASRRLQWDDAAWSCVDPKLCVRCDCRGAPRNLTLDNRGAFNDAFNDQCGNVYVGHEEWLRRGCSRPYQYQPLANDNDDDDDDALQIDEGRQQEQQVTLTSEAKKKKKKADSSSSDDSDSSSSSSSDDSSSSDSSDSSSSSSNDSSSNSSSDSSDSSSSSSDSSDQGAKRKSKKSRKVKSTPVEDAKSKRDSLPNSLSGRTAQLEATRMSNTREETELQPQDRRDFPLSVVSKVVRLERTQPSARDDSSEREVHRGPKTILSKVVRCEVVQKDCHKGVVNRRSDSSSDEDYSSHTLTSKVVRVKPRSIINWEDEDIHANEKKLDIEDQYLNRS